MKGPIYAGADRALVRLASGEYICVDTNSLDAIDYLLGWDMEANVLPLFRSFLQPKSVVLDIGANFGLYTATSASRIRDHGRLYSFEANPHTFDLLKRTLYANRLAHHPNVIAVNALVGDSAGRGTLHYLPEFLGGATMTDIGQWGDAKRSIELDMITIDEFLPDWVGGRSRQNRCRGSRALCHQGHAKNHTPIAEYSDLYRIRRSLFVAYRQCGPVCRGNRGIGFANLPRIAALGGWS